VRTVRLPLLLRRPAHPLWYGLLWAPYIAIYQLSNRFPLAEPRELPFTALDRSIPFTPELLPLYVAYIPFYWWTVASARDDLELNRIFYATHLQMLICLPLFLFTPIAMPRELFYGAASFNWADTFWRWFDGPNNCLPSLHAANCLLLAHLHRERQPTSWSVALHSTIAAAIIASTLLVKQHYVVDLVAGAMVYAATTAFLGRLEVCATAGRLTSIRRLPSHARPKGG